MATSFGEIFVRVGAHTKGFEKSLDRIQAVSAKVFAGVAAGIAGVSVIGAKFEKQMAKAAAITGATGKTFEKMEKTARSVATTTEFTASEAAEGMAFFAMAGYSAEQAMAALEPTAILATTGFMDLGRAADIVTNIMAGMGIGFDKLNATIDVLIATATSANTTVSQLGYAFSYAGPVMKSFGISIEESAAAMGLLSDAGIQGERAGTNLRMVMTKLAKPSREAEAIFKRLGIEIFDAGGEMYTLTSIFGQIAKSGASAQEMMKLFGSRAGSAALVLTESMRRSEKTLESFTAQLKDSEGTADRIFERMSQTVAFQFNVLRSNVEEAALVLWTEFKPAIMNLIGAAQVAVKAFAQLDPKIHKVITTVALATAGLAGFSMVAATAAKILMVAFAPATLAIAAVIVALAALGAAILVIIDNWDNLAFEARVAMDTISQGVSALGQAISGAFVWIFETAWDITTWFFGGLAKSLDWAANAVGIPGKEFTTAWEESLKTAQTWWNSFIKGIGKGVDKIGGWISALTGEAWEGFKIGFEEFTFTGEAGGKMGGGEVLERAADSVASGFDKVVAKIKKMGFNLDNTRAESKALAGALNDVAKKSEGLDGELESTTKETKNFGEALKEQSKNITGVSTEAASIAEESIRTAQQVLKEAAEGLIIPTAPSLVTRTPELSGVDLIRDSLKNVDEGLGTLRTTIVEGAKQLGDSLWQAGQRLLSAGGEIGGMIQAGISGAATGGPIGAIIAVITELLLQFESIMESFEVANQGIEAIATAMSPIFDGLVDAHEVMNESLFALLDVFGRTGGVFDALSGVLEPLFEILGPITDVLLSIVEALGGAIGPALETFGEVLGTIMGFVGPILDLLGGFMEMLGAILGGLSEMGEVISPLGPLMDLMKPALEWFSEAVKSATEAMTEAAEAIKQWFDDAIGWLKRLLNIKDAKRGKSIYDIAQEAVDRAVFVAHASGVTKKQIDAAKAKEKEKEQEADDFGGALGEATDGLERMNEQLQLATESLLNVPSGFKMAAARMAAITAATSGQETGGAIIGMGTAPTKTGVTIQIDKVVAEDPSSLVLGLQQLAEWNNLLETGTSIGTAPSPGRV